MSEMHTGASTENTAAMMRRSWIGIVFIPYRQVAFFTDGEVLAWIVRKTKLAIPGKLIRLSCLDPNF